MLISNSVACQGEMVTVYIGPEKKPCNCHKDLICYHSEYFRTAYNGRWREAEEGVVLADIEPEVFNLFLHWMYTQNIPSSDYDIASIAYPSFVDDFANMDFTNFFTDFKDIVTCDFLTLKSCIFGDRFLAPKFKEAAHNAFVDLRGHNPPMYEHVIYAFEHLQEEDLMLALLVDTHSMYWQPVYFKAEQELQQAELPHSFLLRVMTRTYELKTNNGLPGAQGNGFSGIDICSYHYHDSEYEREACPVYKKYKEYTAKPRARGCRGMPSA
jgi:hypothetical protein